MGCNNGCGFGGFGGGGCLWILLIIIMRRELWRLRQRLWLQ